MSEGMPVERAVRQEDCVQPWVEPVFVASVSQEAVVGGDMKVEKRKPREAVVALEMLAEGQGYEAIKKRTGLGFEAISGLKARHEVALDVRRRQMAADGFELAEGIRLLAKKKMAMLADDDEALGKVSLKDLILSNAIAQDKGMAALGENKSIIEHRTGRPSLADAKAAIEEARKGLQKGSIEIITEKVEST